MWSAYEASLEAAPDGALIAYAHARTAVLVTTNRDCAQLARRLRLARVIWLQVREVDAEATMVRALNWLGTHRLPDGMVLRVGKNAEPVVLSPLPAGGDDR